MILHQSVLTVSIAAMNRGARHSVSPTQPMRRGYSSCKRILSSDANNRPIPYLRGYRHAINAQ